MRFFHIFFYYCYIKKIFLSYVHDFVITFKWIFVSPASEPFKSIFFPVDSFSDHSVLSQFFDKAHDIHSVR